jgi:hypothetical protein
MTDEIDPDALDRTDLIVAREAITNLLVNDWSAMDRDALRETEADLSHALGRDPEFSE